MKENREYWTQCRMVYDASTEEICYELPKDVEEKFHNYITRINKRPNYNVWFDERNPKIFGADETYLNSPVPNEASFLDTRANFLNNEKYGVPSISRYSDFFNPSNGLSINSDGFFESTTDMKKYKDSTILIVGGGPSTNVCSWENEDRDYTWTCNHFYNNQKIVNSKIDLFYINAETHMGIEKLKNYVKQNDTVCAADTTISRPDHILKSFKEHDCKTVLFGTRMFLTSGAAPKLVALALLCGASKIKIVGMDGWTEEQINTMQAGDHAFEKGKKLNISSNYTYDFQRRENVVFWDYILTQYPNVQFKNLGESYKNNSHAEITKKILS